MTTIRIKGSRFLGKRVREDTFKTVFMIVFMMMARRVNIKIKFELNLEQSRLLILNFIFCY